MVMQRGERLRGPQSAQLRAALYYARKRRLARLSASSGGPPAPSDLLGFTGPVAYNNDGGFLVDPTIQVGSRPFTLTVDFECTTDAINHDLFSIWDSLNQSIKLRIQGGANIQLLGSTTGSNSNTVLFDFTNHVANTREVLQIQRVGNTITLKVDDVETDSADVTGYFFDGTSTTILANTLIGTLYAATFTFDD